MWRLWITLGLLSPGMAFAAGALSDMDYVVSGGFTTYVNAFTRLKYIFADSQYKSMVVSMVVMAIPIGMMAMVGKATVQGLGSGKPSLNFGWLALWLLGSIVYRGTMVPTSTIHIYDQDRNLYQPVAGVPSVMVLAAGVTNRFTQMFRDVVIRNSASTDRMMGEGAPIKMFSALVSSTGAPFDPYLKRNITEFWHSCADVAAQTNGTTFDRAKVLTGSNRLLADLAPLANPAVYSEWYSATAPYNSTVTCTDAYTKIKTAMAVSGSAGSGPFGDRIKSVCQQTGYSSTNASQLADCATQMEKAVQDIFGDSGLTLTVASQNIMLAQSISDSLLQDNPNAALKQLVNRSMVNAGIADATGSPEWISEIKAGVVSVVLAMMPILLMLVVTPLIGKVLPLVLGLWVFIAAWDICDMMLLQAANDQIYTVMDELRRSNMGLDMLTLAPTASMKALSVLAASREHAMQMALVIAGLFGVSAYAMQSLGNRLTANLDKANDAAAQQTLTTEGRGDLLAGTTRGVAEVMAHDQVNIGSMANAQAFGAIRDATSVAATASALGGVPQAAQRAGTQSAAQDVGRIQGTGTPAAALGSAMVGAESEVGRSAGTAEAAKATGQTVASMSQRNTAVGTEREVGATAGTVQAADATGQTVASMSQQNTAVATSAETGRNAALLGSAGTLDGVSKQSATITSDQTATAVGGAQGRDLAAQDLGMSKTQMAAQSTHANTASQTVEGQRQIDAANNTAGGWVGVNTITNASNDAALKQFGQDPDQATAHQSQLLAEGVSQSSGRNDVYNNEGGLERVNHAAGVDQAANNAGTANALDQSPNAVKGLVDASSNKTAEQIGQGNTLGNKSVQTGVRSGGIHAQETLANNHVYDMLNAAGFSDRELAQAKVNNHVPLSVNPEQAEKLHDSGILNEKQYQAIKDNGSGAMVLDLAQDKDGHILATTQVSAGDSTSINNSWTQDESRRLNKDDVQTQDVTNSSSGYTMDPGSNRRALADKDHLLKQINNVGLKQAGQDFAQTSSQVLGTVVDESVDRSSIGTAGVGGSAGAGTDGRGASVNANASMQLQSADASRIDTQRTVMQAAWNNAENEGRGKGLEGDALNKFVASKAADSFERAFDVSEKYAQQHKGDSAADIVAATPLPKSPAALGQGGSEFYGPGATLAHVYNPANDPVSQESSKEALAYANESGPGQQATSAAPGSSDSSPVAAPLPSGADSAPVAAPLPSGADSAPVAAPLPSGADAAPSASAQSTATNHVENVLQSGRHGPESKEDLTENFAHAQNQLEQVAAERGLGDNWVNGQMRQYTDTVINAPKGAENQAAKDALVDAGVNVNNGTMPPIPVSKATSSSSQMPPIDTNNYRDGVNGF